VPVRELPVVQREVDASVNITRERRPEPRIDFEELQLPRRVVSDEAHRGDAVPVEFAEQRAGRAVEFGHVDRLVIHARTAGILETTAERLLRGEQYVPVVTQRPNGVLGPLDVRLDNRDVAHVLDESVDVGFLARFDVLRLRYRTRGPLGDVVDVALREDTVSALRDEPPVPVVDVGEQFGLGVVDACSVRGRDEVDSVVDRRERLYGRPDGADVFSERRAVLREDVDVLLTDRRYRPN